MTIDVLALGDSVKGYEKKENVTIGVNDIFKHHPVDHLVCVDAPDRFTRERLLTIKRSTPQRFYSPLLEWGRLVNNFELVTFGIGRGILNDLDRKDVLCYSNNSAFVAVCLAHRMGAKVINLYGADFNTHPHFKDHSLTKALNDFKNLTIALSVRGVELRVTKESRLSEFITTIDGSEVSRTT